ncbi:MAG: protein kinase [Sandaracinus sp.]|nr:protein kinase [Sandaracinus sp.]
MQPRYRPLFTLARGGMGRIDVAHLREGLERATFERLVAVKRLHEAFAHDEELVGMLLDEARIAGTIRHANVVSVLDVGRDDEGPFLVMDLVEGLSLHHVSRAFASEGLLPLQIALRILRQVAAGLHAAHESRDARGDALGVVHRDVSPQNVLVGFDGTVRLTDFGIAKALGASSATAAGVVKGKLRYMAPEQLTFGTVDRRTDLYALGVLAFELIAGHHPYEGTPEDVARATMAGDATPDLGEECPELPSALVELLFRLLARDPALRPADAAEVGRVLDGILAELVTDEGAMELADFVSSRFGAERERVRAQIREALDEARSPSVSPATDSPPPTRAERPKPPRRTTWAWVALALTVALGGVVAFVATRSDEREPVPSIAAPPVATSLPAEPEPERVVPAPAPVVEEPTPAEPPRARPSKRRRAGGSRLGAWSWEHESQ